MLYFVYLFEMEPHTLGNKLDKSITGSKDISREGMSKVLIIATICTVFTLGTVIADSMALWEYTQLPKDVESYISYNSNEFTYLHAIPVLMLVYDILSLAFIFPFIIKSFCYNELKLSGLLYTLLSPLTCLATHSFHIIFAFINNPYHATSVLLFFLMILYLQIIVFQTIYYYVSPLCESCMQHTNHNHDMTNSCIVLFCFYFVAIFLMAVPIALTVTLLIVLPLSNAIEEASNRIYAIYQASVTIVAALVTWKIFFQETNSFFSIFIKAGNKFTEEDEDSANTEEAWESMSDKEKEIYLAKTFLSYVKFKKTALPTLRVPEDRDHCMTCSTCLRPRNRLTRHSVNLDSIELQEITS